MQERRFAQRRPVNLEVILQYYDGTALRARTRDLALHGAFVRTPASVDVGAQIAIDLPLPYCGQTGWHRVRAEVVRAAPDGVALRFSTFDNRAYTGLIDVVYGRRDARLGQASPQ